MTRDELDKILDDLFENHFPDLEMGVDDNDQIILYTGIKFSDLVRLPNPL